MKKILIIFLVGLFSLTLWPSLTQAKTLYKSQLGVNVHWALDAFDANGRTESFLKNSGTKWVREHFYTKLLEDDNEAWLARYDDVVGRYKHDGISVVGMLAYGPDEDNQFQISDIGRWKRYIRFLVERYKSSIHVWQVWNEPDSSDFLQPNTMANYRKILWSAYDVIKEVDPSATVLTAGISYPNEAFIKELYETSRGHFDALALHLYYCRNYHDDPTNQELEQGLTNLYENVIKKYNSKEKIWVTEMGCSTEGGITEDLQKEYLMKKVPYVASLPYVNKVFLYTYRDRETGNSYEDHFGLIDRSMDPKPAFWWYSGIMKGPYNQFEIAPAPLSAKAAELRKGLESYFGAGKIPVSDKNWSTLVDSYVYGGYPIPAIARAIKFGGKTVHPTIPWSAWSQTDTYKEWIKKPF